MGLIPISCYDECGNENEYYDIAKMEVEAIKGLDIYEQGEISPSDSFLLILDFSPYTLTRVEPIRLPGTLLAKDCDFPLNGLKYHVTHMEITAESDFIGRESGSSLTDQFLFEPNLTFPYKSESRMAVEELIPLFNEEKGFSVYSVACYLKERPADSLALNFQFRLDFEGRGSLYATSPEIKFTP